jgi:hypothetical protein
MDEIDLKILESIRKKTKIPGQTVDVKPEDILTSLELEDEEYKERLVSLYKSGHLLVYTGNVAGITSKGLTALKKSDGRRTVLES